MVGSLAYLSDKYDNPSQKFSSSAKLTKINSIEITNLECKIENL